MHNWKSLIVVDVIVTCFSRVTPVAWWIRSRNWGGVMGMRKSMKRKDWEEAGVEEDVLPKQWHIQSIADSLPVDSE